MSAALALALLTFGMLLTTTRAAAEREVARFAIVLGNNAPEAGGAPALRYADDDAVATHRLLREAGITSILLVRLDADSRRLYPDLAAAGSPRASDFERAYANVAASMREVRARGGVSELLLFYSGHGDVDGGEGYVVLEDARLTRSALYTLLSGSPATRNHVFIDACKSYFLAFEKGPGGRREPYVGDFGAASIPATLPATGFVLSTSSDRDSHEWERYQAGILSHELRSALRGAADADGDRRVTYAEIGAFLAAANRGIANPRFRPDFMVRPPEDDLHSEVLRWSGDRSEVRFDGPTLGHLYVETPDGARVADLHPDAKAPLTLHLPAERPLFVRDNDDRREYVIASRDPVRVAALEPVVAEVGRRGALHIAFAQLFTDPFGPADVVAFEQAHHHRAAVARSDAQPRYAQSLRRLRLTAGILALGGAASALSLSTAAMVKYAQGSDASQIEVSELNREVRRLNLASIAGYALASAAGATWSWLFARSRRAAGMEPAFQLHPRQHGFAFGVIRAF